MIYIISPHFDDAIGSCGGMISKYRDSEEITIVTVFTKEAKQPLSEFAIHLNALWKVEDAVKIRTKENQSACEFFNLPYINLGLTEAIYRKDGNRDLYPKEGDIFKEIDPADKTLPFRIAEKINGFANLNDMIILPAAVGRHVDHILVLKSYAFLKKRLKVLFYRDFSYKGPPYFNNMKEKRISISESNLEDKKTAVLLYKSQIGMLFEEFGGIDKYYAEVNSNDGELFEILYELMTEDE